MLSLERSPYLSLKTEHLTLNTQLFRTTMKYIEAKVTFDHADPGLAGDLIAGVFFEFDLQGVVMEDPSLEPGEDWAEDAVAKPAAHAVIGYLQADERLDTRRLKLEGDIARLGNHISLL